MNTVTKPGLFVIAWEFMRLGSLAFGGHGTTLLLLQQRIVERRRWIQQKDVSEALAFTTALPGSTGIQMVAYLGWKIGGWPIALIAAAAFITPATVLMIVVAAGSLALPDKPWVHGALTGIIIAVVGLLASAMWRLARGEAKNPLLIGVLLGACALGFFTHAVIVVVGAGLIGALMNPEHNDS